MVLSDHLVASVALALLAPLGGCGDDSTATPQDDGSTSSDTPTSTTASTTVTDTTVTTTTDADSSSDDSVGPPPDLPPVPSPVMINEIMPSNDSTINGPGGGVSTPDWLELVNLGDEPIELSRLELRNAAGDAWVPTAADGEIAPGAHLVVGLDVAAGVGLWTGWPVDRQGDGVALRFDGALADVVEWTDFGEDISLARIPDSTGEFVSTAWPTPAATNGDTASPTLDPAQETVFLTDVMHRIDFVVSPEQSSTLDLPARPEVVVDATIDGIRFAGVGIKLKGNASYDPMSGKPGFVVDMNVMTPGQEFRGLSGFKLNNGTVIDPTRARDHITYMLAREVGLIAPRVGWAELYISDEYYGLYMIIERHDDTMVEARRPGAGDNAMIFEPMVGWQGDFGSGNTAWDYEDGPEPLPAGATAALDAIDDIVAGPPTDQAVAALWEHMDADKLHTYMAWESVISHYDGYKAPNNWRLYVDGATNKVEFACSGAEWTWDFDVDIWYYGGRVGSWCTQNTGCAHDYAAKVIEVADQADALGLLEEFETQSEFLAPYIAIDPRYPIYGQGSYWYPYGVFDYAYPSTIQHLMGNPVAARMAAIQAFPDLGP